MGQEDLKILKTVFGFDEYLTGQEKIIAEILSGKDVLTIMPTGGGKSLCYQLPALMFKGMTVVVSPLIALMQSQVAHLQLLGVKAASLNSSNTSEENRNTLNMLDTNELKMLYAAPERLVKQETIDLLKNKNVSLLAIDEVHCVSQWGHDFRKEYLELGHLRKALSMVQTIGLTATADRATRKDIIEKIFQKTPQVYVAGFDRPNICYQVFIKNNPKEQLLSILNKFHKHD